jgi:hypothetical protein
MSAHRAGASLAERVRAVVGMDPEPDMLARAKQLATDRGLANLGWWPLRLLHSNIEITGYHGWENCGLDRDQPDYAPPERALMAEVVRRETGRIHSDIFPHGFCSFHGGRRSASPGQFHATITTKLKMNPITNQ